jgi:hypothetical protein
VSTFTVRGYDDAWRAMDLLGCGHADDLQIRFANCFIDVEASARIAGMASAQAYITLQRAIRRQFSWMKYGKRNARLTDRETAATEVRQVYHPNGRQIRYDITNPLNALAEAADEWDEHGPIHEERTHSLFAAPPRKEEKEGWARATRELGHLVIPGLSSRQKTSIAKFGVLMAAVIWLGGDLITEGFKFAGERLDAYAQQQRLDSKVPTTVATYTGKAANLEPKQVAALERDIDTERARLRMMMSDNIDVPILRFIASEAENARPALLRMAVDEGMFAINGNSMSSDVARGGAKAMRKLAKARRDNGGWVTEIVPAASSGV